MWQAGIRRLREYGGSACPLTHPGSYAGYSCSFCINVIKQRTTQQFCIRFYSYIYLHYTAEYHIMLLQVLAVFVNFQMVKSLYLCPTAYDLMGQLEWLQSLTRFLFILQYTEHFCRVTFSTPFLAAVIQFNKHNYSKLCHFLFPWFASLNWKQWKSRNIFLNAKRKTHRKC